MWNEYDDLDLHENCNVDLYSSPLVLRIKFDHARLSDQGISTREVCALIDDKTSSDLHVIGTEDCDNLSVIRIRLPVASHVPGYQRLANPGLRNDHRILMRLLMQIARLLDS